MAVNNDDDERVKEITLQLEDEGVIIDSTNNRWIFKEYSGELDSGCYRIPITLNDYYDYKYPTDPNAAHIVGGTIVHLTQQQTKILALLI